jgi:hypothetical protein
MICTRHQVLLGQLYPGGLDGTGISLDKKYKELIHNFGKATYLDTSTWKIEEMEEKY